MNTKNNSQFEWVELSLSVLRLHSEVFEKSARFGDI